MSTKEASQRGTRAQTGGRAQWHGGRENAPNEAAEARGVGSRRIGQRLTILAVLGAILTALIAWNALLVYAVARIVGVVT